jgi:hypothetical protein
MLNNEIGKKNTKVKKLAIKIIRVKYDMKKKMYGEIVKKIKIFSNK